PMKSICGHCEKSSCPRLLSAILLLLLAAPRLHAQLDPLRPDISGQVRTMAFGQDDTIFLGGDLEYIVQGVQQSGLTRVFPWSNRIEENFTPNADGAVWSIAVQVDGKILVGGDFTNIWSQHREHVARLNSDGSLDVSFNPGANGRASSFAVQTDG